MTKHQVRKHTVNRVCTYSYNVKNKSILHLYMKKVRPKMIMKLSRDHFKAEEPRFITRSVRILRECFSNSEKLPPVFIVNSLDWEIHLSWLHLTAKTCAACTHTHTHIYIPEFLNQQNSCDNNPASRSEWWKTALYGSEDI